MNKNTFSECSLDQWQKSHPLLVPMGQKQPVFWTNNHQKPFSQVNLSLNMQDIQVASERLQRFAPYMEKVFTQTKVNKGIIESPLVAIKEMQRYLAGLSDLPLKGGLWLKCDSHLPISGSVKARGGIYEIIKLAESIAIQAGLLNLQDNYAIIDTAPFKELFANHSVVVGSTGNLGLSIGIMSAQLGFNVSVHMSADARQWKKDLLRTKGVNVVEYEDDYSRAVDEGRAEALNTPNCHFVDDENSQDLFLGYAVAALRLQQQLNSEQIIVDSAHPLFVYLPCGVGGAPGGIAFGLKQVFGDNVHCFFAEPTAAPCMLLGMYTQLHDQVSVQEIEVDGVTCADGLAVGRPSAFVGKFVEEILSGSYTLSDDDMYRLLAVMKDKQNISLEPSALAGVPGILKLINEGQGYIAKHQLQSKMSNATHIAWATGGNMVPSEEFEQYYQVGTSLS
jgi:D-serine dehydratase